MPRKTQASNKQSTRMGCPEHRPTNQSRAKVLDFTCTGFKRIDIADYLDIDEDTLAKHYKRELAHGKMVRTGKLGRNLYLDAINGCKDSRKFWLCTQGGQVMAKVPEKSSDENPPWLAKFIEATRGTKE